MKRIRKVIRKYGLRTPIYLCSIARASLNPIRVLKLKVMTRGKKGRDIFIGNDVSVSPAAIFDIGYKAHVGPRCIFEISCAEAGGSVSIGDYSWISRDCHITSCCRVVLGVYVLVGEFVSIRDTTHSYLKTDVPMARQEDILGSIEIQDDVWIGRGCLIQGRPEGVVIGKGSIIAANSVVTRSIPPMQIWGGVPARFIKERPV